MEEHNNPLQIQNNNDEGEGIKNQLNSSIPKTKIITSVIEDDIDGEPIDID